MSHRRTRVCRGFAAKFVSVALLGCGANSTSSPPRPCDVIAPPSTAAVTGAPSTSPPDPGANESNAKTGATVSQSTSLDVVALPPEVNPRVPTRVRLPNYRSALVIHGTAETSRAMIYLHGVCGNVDRIKDWGAAAASHVTTIAIYGNKPCPTSATRFSWNQDVDFIHELAQKALARVAETRGGHLDVERVVLFGYSQGASRAERLVERYPAHYPWLILGGPPSPPTFDHLKHTARSAILVGSEEHQDHLRDLAAHLTTLGAPTRFDVFPGVGHGGFGPGSSQVMTATLTWLLQAQDRQQPSSHEP